MIFVTVGAQMPFDRLVEAVDRWAGRQHVRHMAPHAFRAKMVAADLIVAHAGMGSILTALELGKPILVMPRRGDLMETRNDHQVATARKLSAFGRVTVAMDEHELAERLQQMGQIKPAEQIGPFASPSLLRVLRSYIGRGKPRVPFESPAGDLGLTAAEFDLARRVEGETVLAHG